MALARIWSCALAGLRGEIVQVEVDIHHGLPATAIVGLPDAAVRESKDRLYAALRNAGFNYPIARITVNLAPADIRKAGPTYDLPIALGILVASEQLEVDLSDTLVVGEMALDGALRACPGILPIAQAAKAKGFERLIVPEMNASEAALVMRGGIIAAQDVRQLFEQLTGSRQSPKVERPIIDDRPPRYAADLASLRGQQHARRALEIAAAGGHNLLFSGPPGSGKTLLARCMASILPPLRMDEALEVTAIYSVSGGLDKGQALVTQRPFRSPHHTISNAGLIGGGSYPNPGEVSKAHHGILFLDELPEFDAKVLEVLRQPLEDRHVTISRAAGTATYPASFTLVAARNPCPCGYHGDPRRSCTCSPGAVLRYQRRISGPLLDRIDMHVEVPRVETEKLMNKDPSESSALVRQRVVAARLIQIERFRQHEPDEASATEKDAPLAKTRNRSSKSLPSRHSDPPASATRVVRCNSEMNAAEIEVHCKIDEEGRELLRAGMRQLGLSARAYHRVMKLARTIADLETEPAIKASHLAEALQYRSRDGA